MWMKLKKIFYILYIIKEISMKNFGHFGRRIKAGVGVQVYQDFSFYV